MKPPQHHPQASKTFVRDPTQPILCDYYTEFVISIVSADAQRLQQLVAYWLYAPFYSSIPGVGSNQASTHKQQTSTDSFRATQNQGAAGSSNSSAAAAAITSAAGRNDPYNERHISGYWRQIPYAETFFARFVSDVLFGRCSLAVDTDGVYLMYDTCRSLFIPRNALRGRELLIYRYWARKSKELFRQRSHAHYFACYSDYIYDHKNRVLPLQCAQKIIAAMHVHIIEQLPLSWMSYWDEDSPLNPLFYRYRQLGVGESGVVSTADMLSEEEYNQLQRMQNQCVIHALWSYQGQMELLINELDGMKDSALPYATERAIFYLYVRETLQKFMSDTRIQHIKGEVLLRAELLRILTRKIDQQIRMRMDVHQQFVLPQHQQQQQIVDDEDESGAASAAQVVSVEQEYLVRPIQLQECGYVEKPYECKLIDQSYSKYADVVMGRVDDHSTGLSYDYYFGDQNVHTM